MCFGRSLLFIRCSDPTELGSHFSSLQCPCGGYFDGFPEPNKNNPTKDGICSDCGNQANLDPILERVCNTASQIEEFGYNEKLEELVEAIPGCHPTFHLRFQLDLAFLEMPCDAGTAGSFVNKAKSVINTLQHLDPGCSKLMGKYLRALAVAQQKLLVEKMRTGEVDGGEVRGAMRELTATMIQATKLASDFCIVVE